MSELIGWQCGHESCYGWLWRNGAWQALQKSIFYSGPSESYPVAMNDHGQIVGHRPTHAWGENRIFHAFLWQDDSISDLGVLAPWGCGVFGDCSWAFATSINENGQIVGMSSDANGNDHFVFWDQGTIKDLGLYHHYNAPYVYWVPERAFINDRGQIAASAEGQAYFWSNGNRQVIGSPGSLVDIAGINENGEVVGTIQIGTGEQHAFVWSQNRGMVDLGTGPHGFSAAWAVGINAKGDVLGFTAPCDVNAYQHCAAPRESRAILWRNMQTEASR